MKPHRVYTLFRNLTFALLPALLAFFCGWDDAAFIVAIVSFAVAVALALVFPVRQDAPMKRCAKLLFGILGSVGLLALIGFLFGIAVVCVDAATSKSVEIACATYPELASQRKALALNAETMVPPEARDIRFKGHGGGMVMGWGRHAEFSCKTTEADFVNFALSRAYVLETNRFVNAKNPGAEPLSSTLWDACHLPERFLSYTFVFGNGGGIWLMFDPATETLRGFYSSN